MDVYMICTCMNELASLCDLLNIREHCEDVRVYIMRILKVIAGTMQLICYAAFFGDISVSIQIYPKFIKAQVFALMTFTTE